MTTGDYKVLRTTNAAGGILAYAPNGGGTTFSHTFDFTIDGQGWVPRTIDSGPAATYAAGVGWQTVDGVDGFACTTAEITLNFPTAEYTTVTVYFHIDTMGNQNHMQILWPGNDTYQYWTATGDQVFTFTPIGTFGGLFRAHLAPSFLATGGAGYITKIVVAGNGNDPFGGAGATSATVIYSSDYGATFAAALPIGGSGGPGAIGGFDVQRSGANSFAAGNSAVYRATTLGGAYSSYYSTWLTSTQVAGLVVPYFTWGGSDNRAATDPDALAFLTAPDSGGRSALWLEGGAASPSVVHDISPVAGMTFDNPNCATILYQHHLACFGYAGGVYHCYTSNDRGATWVDRGALTAPSWIRCRRGDNAAAVSGTNKGQIFLLANGILRYSPDWGVTWKVRTPPDTMLKGDIWG